MMATITPYNDEYRKWGDIDLSENPFNLWQSLLSTIGIDIVRNILRSYPNININWLVLGEGEIFNLNAHSDPPFP